MRWTEDQLRAYEARQAPKHRQPVSEDAVPAGQEASLQNQIMAWCDAQWPRWKYLCPRFDRKSTLQVGAHDITVFGPFPKCLLVECKTATGKLTAPQQSWAAEMRMLGWTVHVVRSMTEFLELVKIEANS